MLSDLGSHGVLHKVLAELNYRNAAKLRASSKNTQIAVNANMQLAWKNDKVLKPSQGCVKFIAYIKKAVNVARKLNTHFRTNQWEPSAVYEYGKTLPEVKRPSLHEPTMRTPYRYVELGFEEKSEFLTVKFNKTAGKEFHVYTMHRFFPEIYPGLPFFSMYEANGPEEGGFLKFSAAKKKPFKGHKASLYSRFYVEQHLKQMNSKQLRQVRHDYNYLAKQFKTLGFTVLPMEQADAPVIGQFVQTMHPQWFW